MASTNPNAAGRGTSSRGRHSRGGLGKYLRARGRRGAGRPAEFRERLVLEDEQDVELDSDEEREARKKYSRRTLESNEHRYEEKKTDNDNPDEEEEEEPEVDLSAFLERQRLDDPATLDAAAKEEDLDDTDVDHTLKSRTARNQGKKGQVHQIEWDRGMDQLQRDKLSAEAARDLKARFKGEKSNTSRYAKGVILADPELEKNKPPPGSKEDMESFLDDLLD